MKVLGLRDTETQSTHTGWRGEGVLGDEQLKGVVRTQGFRSVIRKDDTSVEKTNEFRSQGWRTGKVRTQVKTGELRLSEVWGQTPPRAHFPS